MRQHIVDLHITVHIYEFHDMFRYRVVYGHQPQKTTGIHFTVRCSLPVFCNRKGLRELAIAEAWNRATSKDIKRYC